METSLIVNTPQKMFLILEYLFLNQTPDRSYSSNRCSSLNPAGGVRRHRCATARCCHCRGFCSRLRTLLPHAPAAAAQLCLATRHHKEAAVEFCPRPMFACCASAGTKNAGRTKAEGTPPAVAQLQAAGRDAEGAPGHAVYHPAGAPQSPVTRVVQQRAAAASAAGLPATQLSLLVRCELGRAERFKSLLVDGLGQPFGETAIPLHQLLHPPLRSVGDSVGVERGYQ